MNKSINVVPLLLNEINLQLQNNMTPLMIAAITGYPQCQQLQSNTCKFDNQNMCALFYAIKNMNNDVAKVIFQWEKNCKPLTQTNSLMIAAQSGNVEFLNYILENDKSQAQETDTKGWTALYYALNSLNQIDPQTEKDDEQDFKNCLIQVINVLAPLQGTTIPQNPPFTPLQIFIKYDIQQLIQQFINQQTVLDNKNRTCLMYAAMSGNSNLLTPFLQQQTSQDADGCTALIYASIYGNTDAIETLAEQEWELKDNNQNTPVHYAAIYNKPDVITTFDTTYQGDVNDKEVTPFMLACQHDSYECLSLLSEEAQEVDSDGNNCLYYISKGDSYKSLMTILAENMISLDQQDKQFMFDLVDNRCIKCIKCLIDVVRTANCWLIEDLELDISSKVQKSIKNTLECKHEDNQLNLIEYAITKQSWDVVRILASYFAQRVGQNGLPLSTFLQLDADMVNESTYYKAGKALIKYGSGNTNKDKTCASMIGWQSYGRNHNSQAFVELLNELTQIESDMHDSQGHDVQWYKQQALQ